MSWAKIIPKSAAQWTAENPKLAIGEIGIELDFDGVSQVDTLKVKFGDGQTPWTSLGYHNPTGLVKATSAATDTGTNDTDFVTPLSLENSDYAKMAAVSSAIAVVAADVEGVAATGSIVFDDNPADGETKDINGLEVTFADAPGAFPDVQIEATLAETLAGLTVALNAAVDAELTVATYDDDGVDTLEIVHDAKGEAGNSFTLTGGTADFTESAATLEGGVDGLDQEKVDGTPGVKVYRALLTQAVAAAPVATGLENSLGAPVWTRAAVGRYELTLTGAFPAGKVFAPGGITTTDPDSILGAFTWLRIDDNVMRLISAPVMDLVNPADDLLVATSVELLIYP